MATLSEVAEQAGVSPTTVSRYLNNRIELPRGDLARASMRRSPSSTIGRTSSPSASPPARPKPSAWSRRRSREPFFAELASAFEDEAERHGYTVFMSSTRGDRAREIAALNRLHDRHVDGLIMMTNTPDDGTLAALIGSAGTSSSSTRTSRASACRGSSSRTSTAPMLATQHLIEAGHRDIALYRRAGRAAQRDASASPVPARHERGMACRCGRTGARSATFRRQFGAARDAAAAGDAAAADRDLRLARTISPSACCRRPRSAGSPCPTTCRWSASTTCRSPSCSTRR